jgi:hypothetical protein
MIAVTPDITGVAAIRHGVLCLTFADGLSGEIEVHDRMRGPVFADALTPRGFAAVKVDAETGTTCGRAVRTLRRRPFMNDREHAAGG